MISLPNNIAYQDTLEQVLTPDEELDLPLPSQNPYAALIHNYGPIDSPDPFYISFGVSSVKSIELQNQQSIYIESFSLMKDIKITAGANGGQLRIYYFKKA